jgi:hypothetical protein
MSSARPLFVVVLLVGVASSAIAGDEAVQIKTSTDSREGSANTFIDAEQGPGRSSGLIFTEAKPRDSNQLPATVVPLAKLDDGVCYSMRMYKVKRTEHFADGKSASRGYSTCELASNYQFRSATAHIVTAPESDSRNNEPQK